MIRPLDTDFYTDIIVLTGAGISVASGIRPFRGPGGIWSEYDIQNFITKQALNENPFRVWRFCAILRDQMKDARPNAAHYALAKFEAGLKDYQRFMLVTQNIDGLHQQAGSKNVVEIHGNVNKTRCTNWSCALKPYVDPEPHLDEKQLCQLCGSPLRMDIVLFGEGVATKEIKEKLRSCDLFIAIGTSGIVYPAAGFADIAKSGGARTLLVNLEETPGAEQFFHQTIIGKAEEVLPALLKA